MKRLISIQHQLKAPKNQYNSFGKYKYRSCEDILEGVKPLLKEAGLLLTLTDTIESINNRFYLKATATIYDSEGKKLAETTAYAREEETKKGMDGSQVTGAASSYARKYALNGLFAIDDTKDSDATNTGEKTQSKEPEPKNIDKSVYEALSACSKVDDVRLIWAKYEEIVTNKKEFLNKCKKRKGEILAKENVNE